MSPRIRQAPRGVRLLERGEGFAPVTSADVFHPRRESAQHRAEREREERLDALQAERAAVLEQLLAEPSRAEPSRAQPSQEAQVTTKLSVAQATVMHTCITPGCANDARPGHDTCDTCSSKPEQRRRRRAAVTMLSVCSAIQPLDETGKATARTRGQAVTDSLQPKPAPTKPGLHLLTPAQFAGLTIAQADVGSGEVTGYQRELKVPHARAIARRLEEDHPFPPILYAVAGDEPGEIVDGQHRAAGAIIARVPLWAVCFEATPAERRKLFAAQGRAKRLSAVAVILASEAPWHRYMQAALIDPAHAWHPITTQHGGADTLRVDQAAALMLRFVVRSRHEGVNSEENLRERWNPIRANLLPELLLAVGHKRSNPHAWTAIALRAIVNLANDTIDGLDSIERWRERLPVFDFAGHRHIRSTAEYSDRLLEHWNRGLPRDKRITREAA